MKFLFVHQSIVIDIDSVKSLCFCESTVFDGDAELVDYFL